MPIELKCIVCNKQFVIKNNRLGRAKYCSVYCKGVDKKFDASPGIKKNLLTILEEVSPEIQKNKNGPSKIRRIKCICDCGKITTIRITSFYSGYSRSCGCLPKTYNREYENKMPLSAHPIHRVWSNMIQRCTNPKNTHFNYYGGRGVSVCEEWRASFASFYQWSINNGWSRGLQLDKDIKGFWAIV